MQKNNYPKDLKDFRPVVLTANIMKCWEHIVKNYICDNTNNLKNHMKFAFCKNTSRSVQDATKALHSNGSKYLD